MKQEPKQIEEFARFLCSRKGYDPDQLRGGDLCFHSTFDSEKFSDGEYDLMFNHDPDYAPDGEHRGDVAMYLWRDSVEEAVKILNFLKIPVDTPD
jgi:hypothetical protein